jgi:hypothetical protein
MIMLYLNNYKDSELRTLYNAFSVARSAVETATPSNPMKDLDEVLHYMDGYMDAKGDSAK